jgi:hypothetical protein
VIQICFVRLDVYKISFGGQLTLILSSLSLSERLKLYQSDWLPRNWIVIVGDVLRRASASTFRRYSQSNLYLTYDTGYRGRALAMSSLGKITRRRAEAVNQTTAIGRSRPVSGDPLVVW